MKFIFRYGEVLNDRPILTLFLTILSYIFLAVCVLLVGTSGSQYAIELAQLVLTICFVWFVRTGLPIIALLAKIKK